jgi:hypothetical protein
MRVDSSMNPVHSYLVAFILFPHAGVHGRYTTVQMSRFD